MLILLSLLLTMNAIALDHKAMSHQELAQLNMATMADMMNRYYANPVKHNYGVIAGDPRSSVVTELIDADDIAQALGVILPAQRFVGTVYVDQTNNAGLIEKLMNLGFSNIQKPCMHLDLNNLVVQEPILPVGFEVKTSTDADFSFDDWASGERSYFKGYIPKFQRWAVEGNAVFYTGYFNGHVAARQMLYRYKETLQQYFAHTESKHRRKGYARALLLYGLLQHKKQGYKLCTNQVTHDGFVFSRSLGFEQHSVLFELENF